MKTGFQSQDYYRMTCAETAVALRQALKTSFPGVTFSVRSKTYSGGASIDVSWTDGPTSKEVERVTNFYEGATFDGMIDLKSYKDAVTLNGKHVKFGADYIFENRKHSVEFVTEMARRVSTRYGEPMPEVKVSCGDAYVERDGRHLFNGYHDTMGDLVWEAMQETSAYPVIQPEQTREPVVLTEEEIQAWEAAKAANIPAAEVEAFIECKEAEVAAGVTSEADAEIEIAAAQTLLPQTSFYHEFVTALTEAPEHAAELAASIKVVEDVPEFPEPVYAPAIAQAMDALDEARTIWEALQFQRQSKAFAIANRNFDQAVTNLQLALRASMN